MYENILHLPEEIVALEQERRLSIIKPVADAPFNYQEWQERAAETLVDYSAFAEWCNAYKQSGPEAVKPTLVPLTAKEQQKVLRYLKCLEPVLGKSVITDDDIQTIMQCNNWSEQRARNWLTRYQTAGPWGLTNRFNPLNSSHKYSTYEVDLGGLDENILQKIYERYRWIEPLINQATNERVRQRVTELNEEGVKISERTLWNYLRRYRKHGLIGLHRQARADKDIARYLSAEMVEIIKNLRISGTCKTVESTWERACQFARDRGEPEPTQWKVREIIKAIPDAVLYLADGRTDLFKNKTRITGPIIVPEDRVIIQIDTTPVNVLVIDKRPRKGRQTKKKVKTVRMYLVGGVDMNSRRAFPPRLVYDRPDRFVIGGYIRQIVLEIGLPDEIWTDRGKEYIAKHVQRAASEIGLELVELPSNSPQMKGRVERFFGTLDTRLWQQLPGYTGRNLSERPPNVTPELTPDELLAEHLKFIEKYNNEVHSETGVVPNQYWEKHYYTLPVDPVDLDIFLQKTVSNRVQKSGVPYNGNYYWHDDIHQLIGQYVDIRVDPYERHPAEIVIYHRGKRFGVAHLEPPTRRAIRRAQKQQRTEIRQEIDVAKEEIAKLNTNAAETSDQKTSPAEENQTRRQENRRKKPRKLKKDPWEGMPG